VSFRQHAYSDFAALQTSFTVYTRCYISRCKGSEREVGHLLLHLYSMVPNPKENYLLLQHALNNFTLLSSLYPYISMAFRSYLFIHGVLYHLLSVLFIFFAFFCNLSPSLLLPLFILSPLTLSKLSIFRQMSLFSLSYMSLCMYFLALLA